MNKLKLTNSALGELLALPGPVRWQIRLKFDELKLNAHPVGSEKMKAKHHEGHPVYRLKSGNYRVLYTTPPRQPPLILIIRVGDRKDVYR